MLHSLSASDLLGVWEHGNGRLPIEQGLLLLRATYPDAPVADLPRLSIGQRDAALMRLREKTFGSPLNGLADCPICGEKLEIGFPLEELFSGYAVKDDFSLLPDETEPMHLSTAGFDLTFRLPTSADLMQAARLPDPETARRSLLESCLLETRRNGQQVSVTELPADVIHALAARMDEVDPLANVSLPLTCPVCGHQWEVVFDIISFFWSEISAWAQRMLREVHILASAYGWREADILAMSAWRRQKYLELVGV